MPSAKHRSAESFPGKRPAARRRRNPAPPEHQFPLLAAVGGSAGSLEGLTEFFSTMPADCGLAFVVVLHLPPRRESRLANILQRHTHLPVLRLRSRQVIEPNHIYVVPPGRAISLLPGCFKIGARELKAPMRSLIDSVFSALAEKCSSRVAGVLFSGADSDGAAGIEHIHRCGGLTLAQDPEEAAHGVMPRATIAAVCQNAPAIAWAFRRPAEQHPRDRLS